jgi:4-carboxymuconolactone decarboxylase
MADEQTARRNPYADIAPALGDYTDNVLFGEVWERPGLSKRDRSLC